jgi:hypothetical protein
MDMPWRGDRSPTCVQFHIVNDGEDCPLCERWCQHNTLWPFSACSVPPAEAHARTLQYVKDQRDSRFLSYRQNGDDDDA